MQPSITTGMCTHDVSSNLSPCTQCAKELGDANEVLSLSKERALLKKKLQGNGMQHHDQSVIPLKLEHSAMQCRLLARKFALEKNSKDADIELRESLDQLKNDISCSSADDGMRHAAIEFQRNVLYQLDNTNSEKRRLLILNACDILR